MLEDYPGYGVDKEGQIWSFKRITPYLMRVNKHGLLNLFIDGKVVCLSVATVCGLRRRLSSREAEEVRARYKKRVYSIPSLAKAYRISPHYIRKALRGEI